MGNGISVGYLHEKEHVSLLDTEAAHRRKAILRMLRNPALTAMPGVEHK